VAQIVYFSKGVALLLSGETEETAVFVGRDRELRMLKDLFQRRSASLVLCRGRRRIGKSRLIKEFGSSAERFIRLQGLPPGAGTGRRKQLEAFGISLAQQTKVPEMRLTSWPQAFSLLNSQLDDRPTVVLLDEISWMSIGSRDFPGYLKAAWDAEFSDHPNLVLILCGSVSSWIERNILNNTGFVGRVTLTLTLEPLSLAYCNDFWRDAPGRVSSREKLEFLSVTGGVPRYLEEIRPGEPADQAVARLCFNREGVLFSEFDTIWSDLFSRRGPMYRSIVESLVDAPRTLDGLTEAIGTHRCGRMGVYLRDLEVSGFVRKEDGFSVGAERAPRQTTYRLSDCYLRFYLKHIAPRKAQIERGLYSGAALDTIVNWDSILGMQLETLVLNNAVGLCGLLGIVPASVTSIGPYTQNSTRRREACQIDLLIQTRHTAWVCEVKCRSRIEPDVIAEVKEKIRRVCWPRGLSVRTVLVYEGKPSPQLIAEGAFDRMVSFEELLTHA